MRAGDALEAFLSDPKVNAQYRGLLNDWSADQIAKALTHFAFRNGPIEDMHASPKNQLSQRDMKTLNKFTHNRLAYVVQLVMDQRWVELAILLDLHRHSGSEWDLAEPDDGGMRRLFAAEYKTFRKQDRRRSLVERKPIRPRSDQVAAAKIHDQDGSQGPDKGT